MAGPIFDPAKPVQDQDQDQEDEREKREERERRGERREEGMKNKNVIELGSGPLGL